MRTIRNMTIVMGFSLALFALAATGARAQVLSMPNFSGTFTLPVQVQWGTMTLPAGDYSLSYGTLKDSGAYLVEFTGKAAGSPRGMVLAAARSKVSEAKNALLCIREGNILYVRALELPAIGQSVRFRLPHGVEVQSKMIAKHQNRGGSAQLAQVSIRIERASVKPGAK